MAPRKATETPPGERQPNESAVAFEAFRTYVEQAEGRSTARVAQALGKSKTLMDRWSSTHRWVERVRDLDSAAAAEVDAGLVFARRKAAQQQAKEARLHAHASTAIVGALLGKLRADPQALEKLDVDELVRLASTAARSHKAAVETERLALGMTTMQAGQPVEAEGLQSTNAKLSGEELDAMLEGFDALG